MESKKRILSGIQPTGNLHFGRYFGAVSNWVNLQETYHCFYCVVDYHAMTMPFVPAKLRENSWELAINLLAAGINPENLFIQSMVPEHTELSWIMNCYASYGQLSRMTQFKDKSAQAQESGSDDFISAALFDYPVLQAADILIYKAHYVPVGKDQEQHVEFTRNIAQRFNNQTGKEYFVLPEALFTEFPKIMSTADPTRKMSASLGEKHNIDVFADPERIRKQVENSEDDVKNASQPQALAFVTNEMKRVNYDLREFMRILYNTRAYQSISTAEEPDAANKYFFQGPILRRMRAEQAWDSLTLLEEGPEIDSRKGRDGSFLRELLKVDFEKDSMESIFAKYEAWKGVRGDRMGLAMIAEPGTLTPSQARNEGLRASEMKQPADPASMLDTFGQSDRMVTDQHNFDGSVPQVLALMNGSVTSQLTGSSSKLVEDLSKFDGPDDKVRGVFFTLLSRFPSNEELDLGMKMMADYGDDGIRDLGWALMNSPEFLYVQ